MNNEILTYGLELLGAFTIGYLCLRGGIWIWEHKPSFKWKNPIKSYIRREVINYLKEIQNEG